MKNWKKGLIGTAIISIGLFLAACSSSSTQDSTTKLQLKQEIKTRSLMRSAVIQRQRIQSIRVTVGG